MFGSAFSLVGITLSRIMSLDGTWQPFVGSFSKNASYIISTILWVYWGVCISDMITFYLGKLFRESGASDDICSKVLVLDQQAEKISLDLIMSGFSDVTLIAMIEEKISSGGENMEQIEEIIGDASSHGHEFLLGRMGHIKKRKRSTSESSSAGTSKITDMSEDAIHQIKLAVREEVKNEVKEEMEKSMQAQLGAIIQRLSQKNPMLNLNLDGVLSSFSDSESLPLDVGED